MWKPLGPDHDFHPQCNCPRCEAMRQEHEVEFINCDIGYLIGIGGPIFMTGYEKPTGIMGVPRQKKVPRPMFDNLDIFFLRSCGIRVD